MDQLQELQRVTALANQENLSKLLERLKSQGYFDLLYSILQNVWLSSSGTVESDEALKIILCMIVDINNAKKDPQKRIVAHRPRATTRGRARSAERVLGMTKETRRSISPRRFQEYLTERTRRYL